MIIQRLIKKASALANNRKVQDVRAGLGYSAVALDDGSAGVAYTFRDELGCCCGTLMKAGTLIGKDATELVSWLGEKDLLMAAIGLATVNALLNVNDPSFSGGNVVEAIDVHLEDVFGMVGEFKPILAKVRTITDKRYVFERDEAKGKGSYPSSDIPHLLPRCDVVVLTATSIINHTIDEILPYCHNARQVAMVGPSTPLYPAVFDAVPVHLLAGSIEIA